MIHSIASLLVYLVWGAIAVAATPEAMLLHELDMIDSHMYQYENLYQQLDGGQISDRIFGLNARVYKPKYEEDNI